MLDIQCILHQYYSSVLLHTCTSFMHISCRKEILEPEFVYAVKFDKHTITKWQ